MDLLERRKRLRVKDLSSVDCGRSFGYDEPMVIASGRQAPIESASARQRDLEEAVSMPTARRR